MASNELEVLDPAATAGKLKKTVSGFELNRRHFMAALGAAGVAAGTGLVTAPVARAQQVSQNGFNQVDVLNFLLNIKFLKATLYSFIATGSDLPAAYANPEPTLGTGQMYNTPAEVSFTGTNAAQITDMFNEMYYDELNQVVNLQALLGAAVLPRTTINLLGTSASSNSAATATFTAPAATSTLTGAQALGLARMLEDLSATAFANALPYLTGANLAEAAQILAVDGFHAGAVRLACIQTGAPYQGTLSITSVQVGTQSGSTTVYAIGAVAATVLVGQPIVATGIPAGAEITAISSAASATFTGIVTSGSKTITSVSSVAAVKVGQPITGTDIPALTVVTAVGTNTVTISNAATATITAAETITVGQSILTISEPATATSSATASIVGVDPDDVEPGDPGTGPLAAAGPAAAPSSNTVGFFGTAGTGNATTVTPAGLAYTRTFSQVLAILYGSTVTTTYSGGFFPIGVAGNIKAV